MEWSEMTYDEATEKYRPAEIKVLFVAESPPDDPNRHFYFEHVEKHDSLFINMMRVCFPSETNKQTVKQMRKVKAQYLERFKGSGFFLIDASKTSIAGKQKPDKLPILELEREALVQRIRLLGASNPLIILITKTVWEVYHDFLRSKGFKVAHDFPILYPGLGHQKSFYVALAAILKRHGFL